ncbi:hypothetical protein [Bradyrhizobium elkanii]
MVTSWSVKASAQPSSWKARTAVAADKQISSRVRETQQVKVLPDILAFLQKETELTRDTLAEILKR